METLTFQQGHSYIVKSKLGETKIKVLSMTDIYISIEWLDVPVLAKRTYDLQKFKYEYSIVEEVG